MASEDEEQRRTAEARVKTGDFIARLMMAYAGFAAFCVFALLSPDRLVFVDVGCTSAAPGGLT